jgi:phage FluMu protein Com
MFKRHLLKKNTCPPKFNKTSIYDILKIHGFDVEANKYEITHNSAPDCTKVAPGCTTKIIHNSNTLVCSYCNKLFTRKSSLQRHINSRCSAAKSNDEFKILKENNDKLTLHVEQLINKLALLESKTINNISNKTNNINKGTVNNNIIINNYGSENIEYITFSRFVKLLETPLSAIPKLIELKFFNEKHPENHNIKITNIHDKFAKIYKDKKWLVSNKKDIIQELVDNGYADFEEFKDLNEEELTNKIKERYKKMDKYYTQNGGELYKQSEMSIINGTNKSFFFKDN